MSKSLFLLRLSKRGVCSRHRETAARHTMSRRPERAPGPTTAASDDPWQANGPNRVTLRPLCNSVCPRVDPLLKYVNTC